MAARKHKKRAVKHRKSTKKAASRRGRKTPLARAAHACKGKSAYKSCVKKMIKKFKKKK